jgi:hypothetical protein
MPEQVFILNQPLRSMKRVKTGVDQAFMGKKCQ